MRALCALVSTLLILKLFSINNRIANNRKKNKHGKQNKMKTKFRVQFLCVSVDIFFYDGIFYDSTNRCYLLSVAHYSSFSAMR